MRVYKIGPQGFNQAIETDPETAVMGWLTDAEVGDVIEITVMEMTEKEYKALPEYDGP